MRSSPPRILSFSTALLVGSLVVTTPAAAQDYTMYETTYVKVTPGHTAALNEAMAEHNRRFHSEGPYAANVWWVATGSHSGELSWVMGPATFAQLDDRPSGDAHDLDWADEVLVHGDANTNEYWIMNEELTYTPADWDDAIRPVLMVRFFDVADDALFTKVQSEIKAVFEGMNAPRPRTMYRNRALNDDGRDWAIVIPYENWAELDDDQGGFVFEEGYKQVHGEAAWETFQREFDEAVLSREDEFRQHLPELSGPSGEGG